MTTGSVAAVMDQETAERLSRRFNDLFGTFDAENDLVTTDALFDMNMPVWRFQIQGPDAFATQLQSICQGPEWDEALRARHAVEAPMIRW